MGSELLRDSHAGCNHGQGSSKHVHLFDGLQQLGGNFNFRFGDGAISLGEQAH